MKIWSWLIVILILGAVGYFYGGQIKSALMGAYGTSSSSYDLKYDTPSSEPGGAILSWVAGYAVGSNGMTLYSFDEDAKDKSNCSGLCAANWPPHTASLTAASMPTDVTLIARADGTMQFVYKGMPLYYYAGDKKAGDTNGDGVDGTWHLIKP